MTADRLDTIEPSADDGTVPRSGATAVGSRSIDTARALVAGLVTPGELLSVWTSPGSRNTPVAIAFAELAVRGEAQLSMVLDERVAAFAALGAARKLQRPSLLLCTSGSAGGHYLPALMEARHARVPLIAITADRPRELHHCGAPQTFPQSSLLDSAVVWSSTLSTDLALDDRGLRHLTAMGMRARTVAMGSPAGPVHLNAPFRKPLYDARRGVVGVPESRSVMSGERQLSERDVADLATRLSGVGRGVIHIGPMHALTDPSFGAAASELAQRLGWPLIIDAASGVCSDDAIRFGEVLARANALPAARLALRFGGAPTNQHLGRWLSEMSAILVDPDGEYRDPEVRGDTVVVAHPTLLCRVLGEQVKPSESSWRARWQRLNEHAVRATATTRVAGIEAARAVTRSATASHVHVASSMAIRDVDAFGGAPSRLVTSNRGVNGIDGTIGTAFGIARATGEPTIALMGDLAFFHDIGGLLAACRQKVPLTVVVVNNDGGSIFEQLPVAHQVDRDTFETLFATPQGHDIEALACAAGATHQHCTIDRVAGSLEVSDHVNVIEVRQDRDQEVAERRALWLRLTELLAEAHS